MKRSCGCVNCITPPFILRRMAESPDKDIRRAATKAMISTARLQGERAVHMSLLGVAATPAQGRRTIFDCRQGVDLATAVVVRGEDHPPTGDVSVNAAHDHLGRTRDFFRQVFGRDSIDGQGMRLDAFVHRGVNFPNAFWDGRRMIFGDGDGLIFKDLTQSLDVTAHELAHGVTQYASGLQYHRQSGALNESMSDVFGSLVKQWSLGQTATQADWLIGADVFTPSVAGDALRSLKAPGQAFDNVHTGRDPQPGHMSRYLDLPDTEDDDWGGVHINSGIPNHAFYLAATKIGGDAWRAPGQIWYAALLSANIDTEFAAFAESTIAHAERLYGARSVEREAVEEAWAEVGIRREGRRSLAPGADLGELSAIAELASRVEALSTEVRTLSEQVRKPRSRKIREAA